jgi:hypothetical protein
MGTESACVGIIVCCLCVCDSKYQKGVAMRVIQANKKNACVCARVRVRACECARMCAYQVSTQRSDMNIVPNPLSFTRRVHLQPLCPDRRSV